jgi:hypothetical protein
MITTPVLKWTEHRALSWRADIDDGTLYSIFEVSDGVSDGDRYELWVYGDVPAGPIRSFLGYHESVDEAKAAARTHVGDDE